MIWRDMYVNVTHCVGTFKIQAWDVLVGKCLLSTCFCEFAANFLDAPTKPTKTTLLHMSFAVLFFVQCSQYNHTIIPT